MFSGISHLKWDFLHSKIFDFLHLFDKLLTIIKQRIILSDISVCHGFLIPQGVI
jgi:hypothetical protein